MLCTLRVSLFFPKVLVFLWSRHCCWGFDVSPGDGSESSPVSFHGSLKVDFEPVSVKLGLIATTGAAHCTHTLEKLRLFWQSHWGCSWGATRLVWCDRESHLFRLLFFLNVRVDVQPEPNVCILRAEDLLGRAAAPDVLLNHQLKSYRLGMINTPNSCGTLDHSNPPAVPPSNPAACFSTPRLHTNCQTSYWSCQKPACSFKAPFRSCSFCLAVFTSCSEGSKHGNLNWMESLQVHPSRKGMSLKPSLIRLKGFPGLWNLKQTLSAVINVRGRE